MKAARRFNYSAQSVAELFTMPAETIMTVRTRTMTVARGKLAAQLGCRSGHRWLHLGCLRTMANESRPLCWTDIFVDGRFAAIVRARDAFRSAVFGLIEKEAGETVVEIQQEIRAVILVNREALRIAAAPGSPWWRAVNERLLRDGWEGRALAFGHPGTPSCPAVAALLEFIRHPSAQRWYRAHNISVVSAYLEHERLASRESRVERFFMNVVLARVLYAHALVAAPRLALGWLAFAGRPLGDPRLGMTGIFLSLSRVLPDRYPLGEDLTPYLRAEHGVGQLLDVGVIQPRLKLLYDWSARDLAIPGLRELLDGQTPCYAWPAHDQQPWHLPPSRPARLARTLVSATRRTP